MLPLTFKATIASTLLPLLGVRLLCVLVMGWIPMSAQDIDPNDNLKFEHLSAQQGLPKSYINSILQDREGFMWFGTNDGLYKYDGYTATAYQADPANPRNTLRSNNIRAIHEDHKGRLWVATNGGGLHRIDKWTGKVIAYPIHAGQTNGWNELYPSTIVEDAKGSLWLGSSLGIARFDPATQKYSLYPSPNTIYSLKGDENGILWASNQAGIYRFDPNTGKFMNFSAYGFSVSNHVDKKGTVWMGTWGEGLFRMDTRTLDKFKPYNPAGLIKNTIVNIYEADGLWLATSEGLQRIDLNTDHVITYQSDPSRPGSLSSNQIHSVYQDRIGNLWVGTSTGLNKASIGSKPFYTHQIIPTPSSFHRPENEVESVLEDHTGTLWLGSAAKGLYRLDSNTYQLTHVVVNPDDKRTMLLHQVWPLVEDKVGQLWVGTDMEKGLYRLDRATGKFIRYPCRFFVRMLDVDTSGKLWIGGFSNEMASFDPVTKQFTYYKTNEKDSTSLIPGKINDLMVSRVGQVWVATTSGISRLNPKTGKFIRYQPNSKASKGYLNDSYVNAIYEGQEGIIWAGTFQGGLNRLDPHTNTFTYFTTGHGLPSNQVQSIIEDEKGNLWIGTSQGLSRFNPTTMSFRNFNVSDGLPGNEFLKGTFSRKGKLFFGNKEGLVSFYPDSIKDETRPLPVYITGFKVLEQNRALPKDQIELPYKENFLSFEFVALNYDSPEKNRYAYKLEGLEKEWVQSDLQRIARYTDLAPGKYTFRVKATIDERVWNNKEANFTIIIHPPFWKTWWFYSLYGLCFLAGVFAIDRFQRRRLIQREREKARERELEQAREIEKTNKELERKSTELEYQKEELQSTLEHLKTTQAQLLEQEKAGLENELKLERLKQEQELASYQSRTAELEMQALRAQMNPHFIFNCLNSINRFILKNESEAASDYLTKFSKLIRLILQNSQSPSVSLEQELEALRLYIEMEMLRFEGQFIYKISLDPNLEVEDLEVPPLIIQPYVENAIWHGLMHKQDKGHLVIELQRENGTLYCQITDDGVGRKRAAELKSKSASKNKSLGMQITSHRLELINALSDKATTVEVIDLVDPQGEACGTRVMLKIPI